MESSALIIVDMQMFFLKNFKSDSLQNLIDNQTIILNYFVKNKLPICFLEYKAGGILRGTTIPALRKLANGASSHVIIKENNSGFIGTNLDTHLKALGVKNLILMGVNANGCVQDTAMSALRRGYKVITAEGVTASSSRRDLSFSTNNKNWYLKHTLLSANVTALLKKIAH